MEYIVMVNCVSIILLCFKWVLKEEVIFVLGVGYKEKLFETSDEVVKNF